MNFTRTPLRGLLVVEPKVFSDARGFFMESFNARDFLQQGVAASFVQDNVSRSVKGTLRGLHYQLNPSAQGKLVRVAEGAVFDVAVDIRKGSPTFGQWYGYTLSAENKLGLYIPEGFAHGFLVLSETAEFHYKVTKYYDPKADRGIIWNDSKISIKWPAPPDIDLISQKDKTAPTLEKAEINFTY